MANALAFRLLSRESEVDDVVQEAFVTAFTSLDELRDTQAFAAWLYTIVVHTARRSIRRRRLLERLGLLRREPVDVDGFVAPNAPGDVTAELRGVYQMLDK